MEDHECLCSFGDRCRRLAKAFAEEAGDDSARGGYVEIPPPSVDYLNPASTLVFDATLGDLASWSSEEGDNDSFGSTAADGNLNLMSENSEHLVGAVPHEMSRIVESKADNTTVWHQIRRAYIHYFHLIEKDGESQLEDEMDNVDLMHSQHGLSYSNQRQHSERVKVALHHFHPKITGIVKKEMQQWDETPVWQCMDSASLGLLLNNDDNMRKQMINQSNRIKKPDEIHQKVEDVSTDYQSYVVLPSYPIDRSERDLERLSKNAKQSSQLSPKKKHEAETTVSSKGSADSDSAFSMGVHRMQSSSSIDLNALISESISDAHGFKTRRHMDNEKYHRKLLSFEKMRRAAADERLTYLYSQWEPHYNALRAVVREIDKVHYLMHSSWSALDRYTKTLQTLESSRSAQDETEDITLTDCYEAIKPLLKTFAAVGNDWREDLPHLKQCVDDFKDFRKEAEESIEKIQQEYTSLQHPAVKDESAIRQAWSELEELCIVDLALLRKQRPMADRWLRELSYRRLIVGEKTGVKNKLVPILSKVNEFDRIVHERLQEILLVYMPKHRRIFLRTRDLFDPAIDSLEANVLTPAEIENAVETEVSPSKEKSESQQLESSFSFMSVLGGTKAQSDPENGEEDLELQNELSKIETLLQSVHIYEVQIVSFRVELDTWVTSFCVITHQQFMHFFPLLPGTSFETLKKEAQPALASACVAAWEKGSTPLLSVQLSACTYELSSDESYVEIVISTPPRKKIGLRVGSPEECAEWISKTQRWVMFFPSK